jgi:hypothetical protein
MGQCNYVDSDETADGQFLDGLRNALSRGSVGLDNGTFRGGLDQRQASSIDLEIVIVFGVYIVGIGLFVWWEASVVDVLGANLGIALATRMLDITAGVVDCEVRKGQSYGDQREENFEVA